MIRAHNHLCKVAYYLEKANRRRGEWKVHRVNHRSFGIVNCVPLPSSLRLTSYVPSMPVFLFTPNIESHLSGTYSLQLPYRGPDSP